MSRKKKNQSFYSATLTRYAMQNRKAWPHLRILVLLADNFVYFADNSVKDDFQNNELAAICGVQRGQIGKSLAYLRENHYLVTIGDQEFVNPLYCFQCKEATYKTLIENIVDEREYNESGVLKIKPSYWPLNLTPEEKAKLIRNGSESKPGRKNLERKKEPSRANSFDEKETRKPILKHSDYF
jgi:hypothetical protein